MYRIKFGANTTIHGLTKGPKIVLECDTIGEVDTLITSGAIDYFRDVAEQTEDDAKRAIKRL